MHWCQDETLAAMSAVPVVGVLFRKVHKWYHKASHHKCHNEGCEAHHLDHVHEEPLMPNPPARQVLSVEEVDAHYGQLATILLQCDRNLLGTKEFPPASELVWLLCEDDTLTARWKNKFYEWDGTNWKMEEWCLPKKEEDFSFEDMVNVIREFCVKENNLNDLNGLDPTTTFIKAQKILSQIDAHENTGSSSQGLDSKQEADSGSTQQNQEAT